MIQVTYQKNNGDIIQKYRQVYTSHKIGETTCWGWKVLDIKYSYNGKYYSMYEHDKLLNKDLKKEELIIKIKKRLYIFYKDIGYSMVLLILFRYLVILFKI